MSASSFVGLGAFALTFAAAGYGLLAALHGIPTPRGAASELGRAYLLGVAGLGSLLTLQVIAGLELSRWSIAVTAAVLVVGGGVVGRRRGSRTELPTPPVGWLAYLLGAIALALAVVVLEAYFRAGRLQGLFGWDAGSFWVPKAEAIFYTGGLDGTHFATLPGPSYPPLVPVLQAAFFELRGEVDIVALHLLYWSFLVGFVGAGARVLSRVASPALTWGGILLLVAAGQVTNDALTPQADLLMDALVALAVLCLVVWLVHRDPSLYATAVVFLAAAVLAKREALLLVACVVGALLVATIRKLRWSWPFLVVLAAVPILVSLPWRVWFTRRSLPGDGPEAGVAELLDSLDRLGPAAWLVARAMVDIDRWPLILAVALLAAITALLAGERAVPVFALSFLAFSALGFVWVMWAFPSLPLTENGAVNPIRRLVGAALVPAALLAPVVMQRGLDRLALSRLRPPSARLRLATTTLVALAAVGYPAAVLALDGAPRFPSRSDCATLADPDSGEFVLVYDRRGSLAAASAVRERLTEMGFVGAEVRADGCGRWEVANPTVLTLEQAVGHIADARRVGFEPRLERS